MEGKIASFGGIDALLTTGGKEITATGVSLKYDDVDKCISFLTALGDMEVKPKDIAGKEVVIEFKNGQDAVRKRMVCKVGRYEGFSFAWSIDDIVLAKLLKFALESVVDLEEE